MTQLISTLPPSLAFKQIVLFAYCDSLAAGAKVLSATPSPPVAPAGFLQWAGFDDAVDLEGAELPVKKGEEIIVREVVARDKQVTLITVTRPIPFKRAVHFAHSLLKLLSAQNVSTLTILAACPFNAVEERVHVGRIGGSGTSLPAPLSHLLALDPSEPVGDHFLNAILAIASMWNLDTTVLLYPGRKEGKSGVGWKEGPIGETALCALAEVLDTCFGLRCSVEMAKALKFSPSHEDVEEGEEFGKSIPDDSMMYM
ncbi:hypothetical protein HK104_002169 [Borealophlyctis nickersoniae]|nr:hypothetical protein HK104_002169 [Borealophlyctis nickersoniae]